MTPIMRLARPVLKRLAFPYWRVVRGMTLGVRAMALDDDARVMLVRHSYTPGWHFPGGGVEPGETLHAAMKRELREEAGLEAVGRASLHGVYRNEHASSRDHVAVYLVRAFERIGDHRPGREIVEARFFPLSALPAEITIGTAARLREALDETPAPEDW